MSDKHKQRSDQLRQWYESLLQFPDGVDLERLQARVMEDSEEQMQALRHWFPQESCGET